MAGTRLAIGLSIAIEGGKGWPTALRLVSPCDTDSEKRAVSAARGSGEGIEGCADGAMWPVSL